jgi:hypothetical protein
VGKAAKGDGEKQSEQQCDQYFLRQLIFILSDHENRTRHAVPSPCGSLINTARFSSYRTGVSESSGSLQRASLQAASREESVVPYQCPLGFGEEALNTTWRCRSRNDVRDGPVSAFPRCRRRRPRDIRRRLVIKNNMMCQRNTGLSARRRCRLYITPPRYYCGFCKLIDRSGRS